MTSNAAATAEVSPHNDVGALAAVVTRPSVLQLLVLAWPMIVSRSAQVVIGFVDAAMVAKLGEKALAATTAGATNSFTALILPMGASFAVGTFAAQLFGQGDLAGARRFGIYGLALAAIAAVLCWVSIPALPWCVSFLNYDADVKSLMVTYMSVRLLSGGCAVGLESLGAYYGALSNTRLPMVAQLLAMVLNVLFCWMFISGHLGAPALGVMGSGIAATLATTIAFAVLLLCFSLRVGEPRPASVTAVSVDEQPPVKRLSWTEWVAMCKVGIPAGANWFVEFLAFAFFVNVVVGGLGTTALAAFMSVLQLNSVSFMPAFAIASAGAIFVGQAIGAQKPNDVPRTVRLTAIVTTVWQGMVALCYLVFPAFVLSGFITEGQTSPEFIAAATRILAIAVAWQFSDALGATFAEALRAAGDTAFTFWARAIVAWGVFAPGAWISVRVFGGNDVSAVIWLVVYMTLLAAVLFWRFWRGAWRHIDIGTAAHGGH